MTNAHECRYAAGRCDHAGCADHPGGPDAAGPSAASTRNVAPDALAAAVRAVMAATREPEEVAEAAVAALAAEGWRPVDEKAVARLVRRGVVTVDPADAGTCCGLPRDEDGFCQHRPTHPVYVGPEGARP